jgi:hypothetical protein
MGNGLSLYYLLPKTTIKIAIPCKRLVGKSVTFFEFKIQNSKFKMKKKIFELINSDSVAVALLLSVVQDPTESLNGGATIQWRVICPY